MKQLENLTDVTAKTVRTDVYVAPRSDEWTVRQCISSRSLHAGPDVHNSCLIKAGRMQAAGPTGRKLSPASSFLFSDTGLKLKRLADLRLAPSSLTYSQRWYHLQQRLLVVPKRRRKKKKIHAGSDTPAALSKQP